MNVIVDWLAYAAVGFTMVEIYLMLNKLWSRKHIREVADSISVSGRIIGLIPLAIFTLHYILNQQWQGVMEYMLWLFAGIVQLLIGVGLWVAGNKKMRFGKLFRRAISKERTEISYLAKAIFKPKSQELVLDILGAVAMIDGKLKDSEKEYIDKLAEKWHTNVIWGALKARHKKSTISPFYTLWEDLCEYLSHNPTKEERQLLANAIHELILIDGESSKQEDIVVSEFDFLTDEEVKPGLSTYEILIVPQQIEQEHYLSSQFTSLTKRKVEGGWAYTTEEFRSKLYSKTVKKEFQEHGYFTTILEHEKN